MTDRAIADVLQRIRSAALGSEAWVLLRRELLVDPAQAQAPVARAGEARLLHRLAAWGIAHPPQILRLSGAQQIACRAAKNARADSFSPTNKALHDFDDYRADPAVRNFRQRRSNSRTHRKTVNPERGKMARLSYHLVAAIGGKAFAANDCARHRPGTRR